MSMFTLSKGFPGGSDGKESACKVRDPGSIPGIKWTEWVNLIQMTIISTTVGKNSLEEM